jgi:prevent-host-death family protein
MSVNVRELKAHLSAYLHRVRQGESVEVTSHGQVIAWLVPPPERTESAVEVLRRQPWIRPGKAGAKLGLDAPIRLRGKGLSLTDILLADRE